MKRRAYETSLSGLGGLAVLALVTAWVVAFPPWPDDWDGLGFLESSDHLDLVLFAPHPPGYPVYVAMLQVAAIGSTPIHAARTVAVLAGIVALRALAELLDLPRARTVTWGLGATAVCAAPLVFHAFSGVGSEAPALMFAALAAVGVSSKHRPPRERVLLVGLGVGFGLGVRLSWAPFYVPFLVLLPRELRLRALGVAALGCVAWAAPLAQHTGPAQLVALARAHLSGHMTRWGGTALTEPARLPFLLRDLFVDGLGGGADLFGLATLATLAAAVVSSIQLWLSRTTPVERRSHMRIALVLTVPYLAWVTFGQNLRQQPRHVLPLVVLALYALARAAFSPRPQAARTAMFALLGALFMARTSIDAYARRTIPPPGEQLLAYLRANSATAPLSTSAVFAGPSGRFLDGTEWQPRTHAAASLGDALLAVARMDRLPRRVFVTSEVSDVDPGSFERVATFCRPERLDRRLPCMGLYAMDPLAASR